MIPLRAASAVAARICRSAGLVEEAVRLEERNGWIHLDATVRQLLEREMLGESDVSELVASYPPLGRTALREDLGRWAAAVVGGMEQALAAGARLLAEQMADALQPLTTAEADGVPVAVRMRAGRLLTRALERRTGSDDDLRLVRLLYRIAPLLDADDLVEATRAVEAGDPESARHFAALLPDHALDGALVAEPPVVAVLERLVGDADGGRAREAFGRLVTAAPARAALLLAGGTLPGGGRPGTRDLARLLMHPERVVRERVARRQ